MRGRALVSLFAAALSVLPALPALGFDSYTVEQYTDVALFKARLAGFPVKLVNFDSIKTATKDPVSFAADKYRMSLGMVITGQGGQYASRKFRIPKDFQPVSKYNMYAPGPIDWTDTSGAAGGNATDVTFYAGDGDIAAAGFGVYFIDADWPGSGPCSLQVYEAGDVLLGDTGEVTTGNAKHTFRGFVAIESSSNEPAAVITRAHIVNGSGWAGNKYNEGAALDNFLAGTATFKVAGRVVTKGGLPVKGVTLSLQGAFTLTAKSNATGKYAIPNVPDGTYDLVPTKAGKTFTPATAQVVVDGGNFAVPKFVAK